MNQYQSAMIILNGKQANHAELRKAITHLRNEGHQIQVRIPWELDDDLLFYFSGNKHGVDTIIAAGGDGTVNAVAST